MDEKKETKLREQEELLNKVEKVALSTEKGKTKKTTEEYCKEFEREVEELSPFKDEEVVKPPKIKKVRIKRREPTK